MERELFRALKRALRRLGRRRKNQRYLYTDATILEVYCWSVLNDRPVVWACQPENWPRGLRRGRLPSQSDMSRRLRTASVRALLTRLERVVLDADRRASLVYIIDGKPLPIANHSRDPEAGYGRAVGGKAMGYKLHVLVDPAGGLWGWRVAPMNIDERVIARRLMSSLPGEGYLLADGNYNSNRLFAAAATRGVQLVSPRRQRGVGPMGLGHHPQHPARLRSRDMLENGVFDFGQSLHQIRRAVEGYLGTLSATGGGLTCLPAWVRRHRRVRQWVQVKLIINHLRAARRRNAA
jgi:hypothetical protein